MDSIETIRNLQSDLAEIERIIAWMEESMEINQIDVDILLTKTRSQYNQILNLPIGLLSSPTQISTLTSVTNAPTRLETSKEEVEESDEVEFDPETDTDPEFELVSEQEPLSISSQEVKQQEIFEAKPAPVPNVDIEPTSVKASEKKEEPAFDTFFGQNSKVINQPIPEPSHEPKKEVIRETIAFDLPFQPTEPKQQHVEGKETIAEAIAPRHKSSLNDLLGKKHPSQDVATSITETPVTDIWSAITINERFLFIRELFGNDPEKFKNTVTLLNSLESWEAAQKFIKDRFEWDKSKSVANDFMNIIKRKFLK